MTVICLRRDEIATKRDLLEKGKAYEGDKVIVDPLPSDKELEEDPCGIPIRLGDRWVRLMAEKKVIEIGNRLRIEPFESVLVISKEYIALPRDKMAIILPRARVIQRGLLIHATRVHPTWHGKLAFVIINLSRRPVEIETGAQIASMVVLKAEEGGTLPPREDLGRESLDVDLRRLAEKPAQQEKKDQIIELEEVIEDIEKIAKKYGPPFNIIAEGIKKRFENIQTDIDKSINKLLREKEDELKNELSRYVDEKVDSRVARIVNTWLTTIVVLVLTLTVALIQLTQATPNTSGAVTSPNITTNLNKYIDLASLCISRFVLPLVMVINFVILALILWRIWALVGAQTSETKNKQR